MTTLEAMEYILDRMYRLSYEYGEEKEEAAIAAMDAFLNAYRSQGQPMTYDELATALAAEQAKTARLLRQIRNRELADTGLYDEYGQPYK